MATPSTWSNGSSRRRSSSRCLTDVTSRMLVDRNSKKSGLTVCPTLSANVPTLWRYTHSRLFLQAMSVLREDDVNWDLIPAGVISSFEDYAKLIYAHNYFDYTEMINLAVQFLEGRPEDGYAEAAVHTHVRDDIRYVVVDEYQDVNPLQERPRPGPDAVRRKFVRRRRRRSDDLPVARQRGLEHRHVRRPVRRRPPGDSGRELPLERGRGRGGQVDSGADPGRSATQQEDGGWRTPNVAAGRHVGARIR